MAISHARAEAANPGAIAVTPASTIDANLFMQALCRRGDEWGLGRDGHALDPNVPFG